LLKVLSDAFVAADTGQATLLGLLDLTDAFDTVDHAILIERLRLTFGVVESALHWMTSYMTGRTQNVRYRGEVSTTTYVLYTAAYPRIRYSDPFSSCYM